MLSTIFHHRRSDALAGEQESCDMTINSMVDAELLCRGIHAVAVLSQRAGITGLMQMDALSNGEKPRVYWTFAEALALMPAALAGYKEVDVEFGVGDWDNAAVPQSSISTYVASFPLHKTLILSNSDAETLDDARHDGEESATAWAKLSKVHAMMAEMKAECDALEAKLDARALFLRELDPGLIVYSKPGQWKHVERDGPTLRLVYVAAADDMERCRYDIERFKQLRQRREHKPVQ
jgi:hypothetical protein